MAQPPRLPKPAAWLLKHNPAFWSLDDFKRDGDERIDSWRLTPSYRIDQIAVGDTVVLWRTGKNRARPPAGVIGVGSIMGTPMDDTGDNYWQDLKERSKVRPYVPISMRLLREGAVIRRDELMDVPQFARSEILKSPAMGNPLRLEEAELEAISDRLPPPTDRQSWYD